MPDKKYIEGKVSKSLFDQDKQGYEEYCNFRDQSKELMEKYGFTGLAGKRIRLVLKKPEGKETIDTTVEEADDTSFLGSDIVYFPNDAEKRRERKGAVSFIYTLLDILDLKILNKECEKN